MSRRKDLDSALVSIYNKNRPFLREYPWEEEDERWRELLKCILIIGVGMQPEMSVKAIDVLAFQDMLSLKNLAQASNKEKELMTSAFIQLGNSSATSRKAISLLVKNAQNIVKRWTSLQRFLRIHGQKIAKDLSSGLESNLLTKQNAMKIATVWLQEVGNFPILLVSDPHIKKFCKDYDTTVEQLVEIADRNGLNVIALDDVLAVEAESKRGRSSKRPKKDESTG